MDKLIVPVIVCIILVGVCFWMFNNPNGVSAGINNGATKVHSKVTDFDYNGAVAPGAGQKAP
ncbi:MAG: hypothetical protein ACE3L7_14370 [Candidatus Pristimantibacillus sp.]